MKEETFNKSKEIKSDIFQLDGSLEKLKRIEENPERIHLGCSPYYSEVLRLKDYLTDSDMEEIFALLKYRIMNKRRALQAQFDNL